MFRIRRVHDDVLPANKTAIAEVQKILAAQFSAVRPEEIAQIPEKLRNPFKQSFCTRLYVAENSRRSVLGFALLMHDPVLAFGYLDYIASSKAIIGRGIGAALYERIRDECVAIKTQGLFFECLPDEPDRCHDPAVRTQNAARLRFYEQYGVRPIIGTRYTAPVTPEQSDNLPFLMYDSLDRKEPLRAAYVRKVIRAILERKYSHYCPPAYIDMVVQSVCDDPVRLRELRYTKTEAPRVSPPRRPADQIAMFVTDAHDLHHVRERGYVEAPARIHVIRKELEASGLVEIKPVKSYPEKHIRDVHAADLVNYLRRASANVPAGKSVYPYVFPIRNAARPPKELSVRAGD
jgi:GNAT superfamily N-acetyltransferase